MRIRKESLQLGMDYGTAQNKLRKMFLFKLCQQLGLDVCIRCSGPVTMEDFSIDHRLHWLDDVRNKELFWDLNNLGLAHKVCNTKAKRPRVINVDKNLRLDITKARTNERINVPEGFSWCAKHQQCLPIDRFGVRKERPNGLNPYCRECRSKHKMW